MSPTSPAPSLPTIVCGCGGQTTDEELRLLLAAGVGEVFVGYVPEAWRDRLGHEVSPNRRYEPERQVRDLDQLRRFADLTAAAGARLVVALNEHGFAPEARDLVSEIVDASLAAGAGGFIVAELTLLDELRRRFQGRDVELIASCEAGAYNARSARALHDHGATRMVFARELHLDEISAVVAELADTPLRFEAFVAREYCLNSSAVCLVAHGHGERSHFCCLPTRRLLHHVDGSEGGAIEDPAPRQAPPEFWAALGALHRCGLCAIAPLLALGVSHLKVPGRASLALGAVELVRRVLEAGDRSPAACKQRLSSPEFCAGDHCYYDLGRPARVTSRRPPDPDVELLPRRAAEEAQFHPSCPTLGVYASLSSLTPILARRLASFSPAELVASHSTGWEKAAFGETLEVLPSLGIPAGCIATRAFLGIESCGHRLPHPRHLAAAVGWLRDAGLAVSLVTPVVYQDLWDDLCRAVEAVAGDVELVVNDLGLLLHAARRWSMPLATGRIFHRMKRDQLEGTDVPPLGDGIASLAGCSEAERGERLRQIRERQRLAYGFPSFVDASQQELLASLGVRRLGLDTLPTPLSAPLPPRFGYDLYLPWTYLTSTRACPVAGAVEGTTTSHPTRSCRRSCAHHFIVPEFPRRLRRIVQRGAATWMDCSADAGRFAASARGGAVHTVVVEPWVPW